MAANGAIGIGLSPEADIRWSAVASCDDIAGGFAAPAGGSDEGVAAWCEAAAGVASRKTPAGGAKPVHRCPR